MTIYHYALVEKPEDIHEVTDLDSIDMENVDYKRQPEVEFIADLIAGHGGMHCGTIRGGMFGLATNQVWVLSAWSTTETFKECQNDIESMHQYRVVEQGSMKATVRPVELVPVSPDGIYVIRWIRMRSVDVEEYTRLCLETWPMFEKNFRARCYGVFREQLEQDSRNYKNALSKILMLTWYATFEDWEKSRLLYPPDRGKWARRSEMELAHWAQAGRLA
jgi:hypothetical protein